MTEKRKQLMLDKAKRLYDDIDNHLQKEHAIEWFEKNKIKQTYTNKPTASIFCPTCNIPMLLCQYYGGGFYWVCGQCNCKVEKTGL